MKNLFTQLMLIVSLIIFTSGCSDQETTDALANPDLVETSDGNLDFAPNSNEDVSDIVRTTASDGPISDGPVRPTPPEEPPVEEPPVEEPPVEEPPVEEPPIEEPPIEEPPIEEPPIEEPPVEEPPIEEPPIKEPPIEEPPVEEPPVEEPPVEEPNYQCVDRNYYSVKMLDGVSDAKQVMSFDGPLSSKVNYNYYSWSAHSIIGPSEKGYEGNFFIHEGSDGVSFNFVYNVDAGGSPDNQVKMDVIVEGNNGEDHILISDDSAEIKRSSAVAGERILSTTYKANMHYWSNTDGGSIGPLADQNFKVKVRIYYVGDNKKVVFHSADQNIIPLELAQSTPNLYSEFEVTYHSSKKECSKESDEQVKRNQCIDEKYQLVKDKIIDADWQEKYNDLLLDRRLALKELKEVRLEEISVKRNTYNEELDTVREKIKLLQLERVEKLKNANPDKTLKLKEIDVYYALKIKETTEKYNVDKTEIVNQLDEYIAEAKNQSCKKGGFFKRLLCKLITFIKKAIKAVINLIKRLLGIYKGPMSAENPEDLEKIKQSALKQLNEQHKRTLKELTLEKKERIAEVNESFKGNYDEINKRYKDLIADLKQEVTRLIKERNEVIKEMSIELRKDLKQLADKLLTEARAKRSEWTKLQNKVHMDFEKSVQICFPTE